MGTLLVVAYGIGVSLASVIILGFAMVGMMRTVHSLLKHKTGGDTGGIGVWFPHTALLVIMLTPMAVAGREPPSAVSLQLGAGASLSETDAVVPVARATIDAPVYVGDKSPLRVHVSLMLHGQPGATVNPSDVRTFRAVELEIQAEHTVGIGPKARTYIMGLAGGSTRRDAQGVKPRERFPVWAGAGVAVERRVGNELPDLRLTFALGYSQVCHEKDFGVPRDILVGGHVHMFDALGAKFNILGDVQRPLYGSGRSVFRIATLVSR